MQRILRELRWLPHKFTCFTPSSELLADLRWWDEFLSIYNGVSLFRSSPWINNVFSTRLICLSSILLPWLNRLTPSHHDQRQIVVRWAAWPTDIDQNWQSEHWTYHQYWSLSHSFHSVTFAWALVFRFSLRFRAMRLTHTRSRECHRWIVELIGCCSSFSWHLLSSRFSLLQSLVRVPLFLWLVSLRVPLLNHLFVSFQVSPSAICSTTSAKSKPSPYQTPLDGTISQFGTLISSSVNLWASTISCLSIEHCCIYHLG